MSAVTRQNRAARLVDEVRALPVNEVRERMLETASMSPAELDADYRARVSVKAKAAAAAFSK